MNEKTLLASGSPITQRIDAVKALLAWKKISSDPLPEFVEMGAGDSRLVLVLSKKKDAYYTVTAAGCSCPAATYHPGTRCKHSRKYFPQEANIRDSLPGWPDGLHGPVDPEVVI
ncbi:hypothetical protein [Methanothrix sp.]|jgi:hypothetical protein|uniref:hypothetical protein n=1 Tax=Methanothrix sp. TaxID=90426 RepID=UPI002BF9FCE7|nr:hypothetical protein [Methanothrix sp.]HRW31514.1 hypothetical protein [Methanothrix sp.]